ncbi:hypothetical protein LB505_001348 [Fusarium chuoi]|nr:hypothetical protein LB505_001348 [Fusarium chuoi]
MHVRDSLSTVGTSPSRDSRYGYGSARLSKLAQQRGQLDADYDILALFPQADSKSRKKLAASSTYPRERIRRRSRGVHWSRPDQSCQDGHGAVAPHSFRASGYQH